ncbi:retrovirus-related pol polyprotein from transposon TNT 1-94 [Tanacetum coccineum]
MNDFMIASLYVDDMIYIGSSIHLVSEFKRSMMNMFDMTDLGELHYFLGLEVAQTNGGIFMSQKKYAKDTLQKFNMVGCKIAVTPMNISEKLESEDGIGMVDGSLFRSLIGRLFWYKGLYRETKDMNLIGYTDSDWAGCVEDRRSTSGHCFILGTAAVSWSSKKQATVALSSTEAEYIAATTLACQAEWLRRILCDLGQEQVGGTDIFFDNNYAVMLSRNPVYHGQTRHGEIKHHFIRELIEKQEVNLKICRSEEQLAC